MIWRTQPSLPHQRRSLQMGEGHHVPIGRGLRGDTSLPYPPPRCSQFRSSSLSMHLQGWNPNRGFRYLGLPPPPLPPSLLLFPSVPSRATMRPQSKFHRHTLSNRQRIPQWVPTTRRPVPSRPKPVMPSHMAVVTRSMFLRFMCSALVGSLRPPVSQLLAPSRLRRRWTFTSSSEEASGSRMNPCNRTFVWTTAISPIV